MGDIDREANEFAMHLLVPSYLLRPELKKIGSIEIDDTKTLKRLADKFRVPLPPPPQEPTK